jgi:hypothetical protein
MTEYIPFTGEQFNEFFGGMEFIKITTNDEKENYSHQLQDGYNELKFSENYGHISGGIKFHEMDNLITQLDKTYNAKYIRHIQIPDDADVMQKGEDYFANKIILSQKTLISDLEMWDDEKFCKNMLLNNPKAVKYVKHIPKELEVALVKKEPSIIEYIKEPSEEVCIETVKSAPYLINKIKQEFRTMNVYKAMIDKSIYSITYISTTMSDEELCELFDYYPDIIKHVYKESVHIYAVNKNGLLLKDINKKTKELCETAFNNTPEAIKFMPANLKTYEMCVKAIAFDSKLFEHVPQSFMDNELCMPILCQNPHFIKQIKEPTDMMLLECSKTMPELIGKISDITMITNVEPLEIIKFNPSHIKNIEKPTYNMCYEAVKRCGDLINSIPIVFQDEKMCLGAVSNDGLAIKYLVSFRQSHNVCIKALEQNINSFRFIKFLTEPLIKMVLDADYNLIKDMQHIINDDKLLDNMKMMCVKKNGLSLQYILNPSYELCENAIAQNYKALKFVPIEIQCDALIRFSLIQDGNAIKYVKNQTKELCEMAIDNNPMAIGHVKGHSMMEELCMKAIKKNYKAIEKVKMQTIELCIFAVKVDEKAIIYIKDLDSIKFVHLWTINQNVVHHIRNPKMRAEYESCVDGLLSNML